MQNNNLNDLALQSLYKNVLNLKLILNLLRYISEYAYFENVIVCLYLYEIS